MELLKSYEKDGVIIIELSGKLDENVIIYMQEKIYKEYPDNKYFILDMNNCEYVSSSSLGAIINTIKKLKNRDGKLCVTRVQGVVRNVMEHSGFERVFKLYDSLEDAINEIND